MVKVAGEVAPVAVARTWNEPGCEFAVNVGETAMPLALEVTVAEPENVALAPVGGAVKVTATPLAMISEGVHH